MPCNAHCRRKTTDVPTPSRSTARTSVGHFLLRVCLRIWYDRIALERGDYPMGKSRGVRSAANWCSMAAVLFLLVRAVLYWIVNALLGIMQPGASIATPMDIPEVVIGIMQIFIACGAVGFPVWFLLRFTRLNVFDLRVTIPAPWSPAFCLPVFLGIANAANLLGTLLAQLCKTGNTSSLLPSGGAELFVQFFLLCALPRLLKNYCSAALCRVYCARAGVPLPY